MATVDYAVPTGEFLAEWLEENAMSQAELARRLDVSPKHVSLTISGAAPLSHDMALRLERVTGVAARIWNNFESLYRSDLARLASRETLSEEYELFKTFPINALRERKWVTAKATDKAGVVEQVCRFFGVADFDGYKALWETDRALAAFRKSAAFPVKREAIATWLRLGELKAANLDLAPFDGDRLRSTLPAMRALVTQPVDRWDVDLRSLAAEVGVALVFVPDITGTRCFGATRWSRGHPVVQLSLRGKKDDQFWFTLFHELAHVVLHSRSDVFVDAEAGRDDPKEVEANEFAANILIPRQHLASMPRGRNLTAVKAFAEQAGVTPGIALGRIQRETKDYGWGKSLQVTLAFTEEAL